MKKTKYTIDEEIKIETRDKLKKIEQIDDMALIARERAKLGGYTTLIKKALEQRARALDSKSVTYKTKQFLIKLEKFKQDKTRSLAIELIEDLGKLDLPSIAEETFEEFTFASISERLIVLFEYLIEIKDAKLVDKFLLSKMGMSEDELIECEATTIRKYKQHLKQDGPSFTSKSDEVLGIRYRTKFEIFEFIRLLGILDYKSKPATCCGVYHSKMFEKYLLRAVCGLYGRVHDYVYPDGEYGHRDMMRHLYIKEHDEEYKKIADQELKKEI